MKTYWLYIEPYVFINVKNNEILIFNSISKAILEFDNSGMLKEIIKDLTNSVNMYCIKVDEYICSDIMVADFIYQIRKYFCGDIVDISVATKKPSIMYPQVNIQKDVKRMDENKTTSIKSLSEITIQLTGQCKQNCLHCFRTYLQQSFCFKNKNTLLINDVINIIEQLNVGSIYKINFIGGNVLEYDYLETLVKYLLNKNFPANWIIHLKNCSFNALKIIQRINSTITILVDFPVANSDIYNLYTLLHTMSMESKWSFAITCEKDMEQTESITESVGISEYSVIPYYTGENFVFFSKYIFISKDDIYSTCLGKKDIFIHQSLNANDFGKLHILANSSDSA
ncbi:MAG: TIGR04150 pseudo-rSAM protein [Bacteroidales bacterium]|jgi:pseudo-rSAM protein|nr:TIGR04150 pseudo-rSAM protein [Bacteroidales bacterium]